VRRGACSVPWGSDTSLCVRACVRACVPVCTCHRTNTHCACTHAPAHTHTRLRTRARRLPLAAHHAVHHGAAWVLPRAARVAAHPQSGRDRRRVLGAHVCVAVCVAVCVCVWWRACVVRAGCARPAVHTPALHRTRARNPSRTRARTHTATKRRPGARRGRSSGRTRPAVAGVRQVWRRAVCARPVAAAAAAAAARECAGGGGVRRSLRGACGLARARVERPAAVEHGLVRSCRCGPH
jgi:hypothetical protein